MMDALLARLSAHAQSCREFEQEVTAELLEEAIARIAADAEQFQSIFDKLESHTLHRLVCNARSDKPIGGDMCICVPPELRGRIAAAEARVAVAQDMLNRAREREEELDRRIQRAEDVLREIKENGGNGWNGAHCANVAHAALAPEPERKDG